jgi:hypothetical protein
MRSPQAVRWAPAERHRAFWDELRSPQVLSVRYHRWYHELEAIQLSVALLVLPSVLLMIAAALLASIDRFMAGF